MLCKNGGTCNPVNEDKDYQCMRPSGYNGKHCEDRGKL